MGVDCVTELLDHSFFDVLRAVLVWVTQLSTPLVWLLRRVLELPQEPTMGVACVTELQDNNFFDVLFLWCLCG